MSPTYPFSAIVGMDDLRLALTLCAVSPAVGGVLVRGEKGTAKSTTVRALTALLPAVAAVVDCRFSCDPEAPDPGCPDGPHSADALTTTRPARLVELPVGAAEDRLLGSLDLERAIRDGVTAYEPGLLAAAHRGLLYVDEVNLLQDHLVDVLLDAAAMGRATVERDQVSVSHASSFLLVGTMNPEEGELRPQLLDRFGLTVEVRASRDPHVRAEVVRRGLAQARDPEGFSARFADEEADTAARIVAARALLPTVDLPDDQLLTIAEVCSAFDVDGMRADLVMARAAIAHAAWQGRSAVTTEDIRLAARFALPHRRRRNPFDSPGLDEDALDDLLPPDQGDGDPDDDPDGGSSASQDSAEQDGPEGQSATSQDETSVTSSASARQAEPTGEAHAGAPYRTRLLTVAGVGTGSAGRRSRALTRPGQLIRTRRPSRAERQDPGAIEFPATLRVAAGLQSGRDRRGPGLELRMDDLRLGVREGREGNLVLFCVDASGSMAARRRMDAVASAVLSLLMDAYQRRDTVGLVVFRGNRADIVVPPTTSVDAAARRMTGLPTGGRTPLAEGLEAAYRIMTNAAVSNPSRRPLLVVVTDGRATSGRDPVVRAEIAGAHIAARGFASVVVDCEPVGPGAVRLNLAGRLATVMDAEHLALTDVTASALTQVVRARTGPLRERAA